MSSWSKVKSLFWQAGESQVASDADAETPLDELSDAEFQAMLAGSPHAVPPQATQPIDAATLTVRQEPSGIAIDFQEQYDLAGIADTDEVEQLENFLSRLDSSLPNASKLAAAQAFLGAIGKAKEHVLEDAARKIHRVRGILAGKQESVRAALAEEQAQIEALERRIEQHRQRMEALNGELEGVRHACLMEESRLQAARVFFGNVEAAGG